MAGRFYKWILLILSLAVLPGAGWAVGEDIPWLLFPMGGRAAGMGTAFTAVGEGVESTMWNPAGLCRMNGKSELIYSHMENIVDHQVEYIAYGRDAGSLGYLGETMYLGHFGNPIQRTDYWGYPQGTIPVWDMILATTWSFPVLGESAIGSMQFGTNVKLILSMLDHYLGYTLAVDGGLLWEPMDKLTLSAVVKNIGPRIQYKDYYQSDPLASRFIFGSELEVYGDRDNRIIMSGDMYQSLIVNERTYYGGMEYSYLGIISLRGGYKYETIGKSSGPTYGIGIGFGKFKLDIAMMEGAMEGTEQQQIYSFAMNF